jgi:long-chain fatty acid transport protein
MNEEVIIKLNFMKKVIVLACLLFSATYASAEGYQVNAQSTKQSAMGHVGAAMKLGAESMHFNPAGLGFMTDKIDLSVGMSAAISKFEFSQDGYNHQSDNKPSTPMYVYAGFKILDNLSAGVSVTTPYGSGLNWGQNWKGAHLVQDINLQSFSFQPTLSYRVCDRLSFGAGMMVVMGDFSMSRALLPAGSLNGLAGLGTVIPGLGAVIDNYKDVPAVSTTLSGDADIKVGYNLGVMFDVTEKFTIGLSYRSKVAMHVSEGKATLDYVNEVELKDMLNKVNQFLVSNQQTPIGVPPLDKGTFEAELPMPSNWNLGLTYNPSDRLLVSAEVQFVGWSAYKELNVQFTEEVLGGYSIQADKKYMNTRIYRIGGQYAATNRLDVRLGAYYDESPVRSEYLNPETPSMDKLGLTTGFSFRPVECLSIDFAFSYVTGFGRDGSYTDIDPMTKEKRVFEGRYDVSAITPSLGLAYRF